MHPAQRIVRALLAGLAAAVFDGVLIATMDPSASPWVIAVAMLYWTTAGMAVVLSSTGLGDIAHGVVATIVLTTPWFVELALAPGKPQMLPPLVTMAAVFGVGFGYARRAIKA